jgi:hypothetical protein
LTDLGIVFQFGLTGGDVTASGLADGYDSIRDYGLLAEHPFYAGLISHTDQGSPGKAQFGILVPVAQAVPFIGLKALNLTGAGKLKTLFSAAMGLHFWHDRSVFT